MTSACSCTQQIHSLIARLPPEGPFDFDLLPTLPQPLHDLGKSIESCRYSLLHSSPNSQSQSQSQSLMGPIVNLSETVLSLCHAACSAYDLLDDTFILPLESQWTCVKSPMMLGQLTLHGDEERLLARQIVYALLTNLTALLRDVYDRDKRPGGPTGLADGGGGAAVVGTNGMAEGVDSEASANGAGQHGRSTATTLYGREVDVPVSRTLSSVLSLLGKLFSE